MNITILGTGGVGQAFATRLTGLGHQVSMGTRNVANKKADEKFAAFLTQNPTVQLATFADAAAFGEMIINASQGASTIDILKSAGANNLDGKILIDISNPLDFSKGMPPVLIPELSNSNSLGEEIQKQFPNVKVVKTLNTMWNGIMINPSIVAGGDHTNYICGNDTSAKAKVVELLHQLGWLDANLLDLGDISCARGTEGILPLWLRVMNAKKTGAFNFKIVS